MTKRSTTTETEIVTPDNSAFDIARKKARYGYKTWLVYRRADGFHVARIYTADAIKAAMLATGTQGRFWWINGTTGNICRSWSGLELLRRVGRILRQKHMISDPPGIRVLTDEAYVERMAAAIYMVSLRREVPIMRSWRTLTPSTRAMFLDAARKAIEHIDDARSMQFPKSWD